MNESRKIILASLFIFIVPWILLIKGVAGHVSAGDSAELALAGSTLGIPHSPGYPVFSLSNKLLGDLFWFGNPAYQQNLVSLFWICAALVLLGLFLYRMSNHLWLMFLPLLFLFSPLLRSQAYVTEVFPLAFFWAAFILVCSIYLIHRERGVYLVGFLFGIGVSIHQTLVLLFPAILFFYIKGQKKLELAHLRIALTALLFVFMGLSINLILPIRSFANPVLDWEDPQTLSRFWGLITRERYGFFQLAQGNATRSLSPDVIFYILDFSKKHLLENWGWIGSLLLFIGTVGSLSKRYYRRLMLTAWVLIFLSGPFFFWMANVHLLPIDSDIMNRFVLLPMVGVLILIGLGFLVLWYSNVITYRVVLSLLVILFLAEGSFRYPKPLQAEPLSSFQTDLASKSESMRWDLALRDVGLNALRQIPNQAHLFADRADEMEFILAYLKGGENRRADVDFVDCNAGVTRSIYGDDYYRIWGKPRLARRQKVEGEILQKTKHPVFYATVDPIMINLYRVPWGFLFKAKRLDRISEIEPFPWQEILSWRFNPREPRGKQMMQSLFSLMGSGSFDAERFDEARMHFGMAQRFGGVHRDLQMGFFHHKRQRLFKAREYYRRALESGSQDAALYSNLGILEARRGLLTEAIHIYNTGLEIHPDSVDLLYNLSTLYWRKGEWEKVVGLLTRVLEIDPRHQRAASQYPKAKSLVRFQKRQRIRQKTIQEQVKEKPAERTQSTVEKSTSQVQQEIKQNVEE